MNLNKLNGVHTTFNSEATTEEKINAFFKKNISFKKLFFSFFVRQKQKIEKKA
jgi:hypothetical protein